MSDIQEIEQALKDLIENGEVPSRVTNRLLLAAIIQTREQLEARIEALEVKIDDNPSLVLMFKRKPAVIVRYLLLVMMLTAILAAAAVARDEIFAFIISVIGAL